jgi:hypothetical protein
MSQPRRIAVVIRDRESEALRMALGLTLVDDQVDIFVLGRHLAGADEDVMNLELLGEVGIKVYSDQQGDRYAQFRPSPEIARRLLEYDHVLPY